MRVGAGEMDFQHPKLRCGRIKNERHRIGDEPLGAVANKKAENAFPNQRVQLRQHRGCRGRDPPDGPDGVREPVNGP